MGPLVLIGNSALFWFFFPFKNRGLLGALFVYLAGSLSLIFELKNFLQLNLRLRSQGLTGDRVAPQTRRLALVNS